MFTCSCVMHLFCIVFFFNDTATTEIYTLSLHDALPIFLALLLLRSRRHRAEPREPAEAAADEAEAPEVGAAEGAGYLRSEEHTSELQSRQYLVCRLLLEKKKATPNTATLLLFLADRRGQ